MKKLLSVLLAFGMLLSLAACTQPQQDATEPSQTETTPTTVENPINFFSMSISDEDGNYISLTAYVDDNGNAYVEYVGEEKKVGTFDSSVFHSMTLQLEESGLYVINGENQYEDGTASASMYITFEDESTLSAGYSGAISQTFLDGYRVMEQYFLDLVSDLPVYVPQPVIMGEVDETARAEIGQVLERSGMQPLDMFCISDVPLDENFCYAMGLSSAEGIVRGTSCGPMMSASAYSFIVATVEDPANIEAVRKDFAENINWVRWVCVAADHALIAQKGNMVLCLVSTGDYFDMSAQAIEQSGWTALEYIEP